MKYFILSITFSCFLISACKPDVNSREDQLKTVALEELTPSPVRHDSLSSSQLESIKTIHATFSEVYPISLNESIKNFKRDLNPDREIQLWLKMVDTFNALTKDGQYPRIEQRQEVFSVILASSMMPISKVKSDVELTELSEQEIDQIIGLFMASFKSN